MSEVGQLVRLQQIDSELQTKKRRLSEVLHAQKETEELLAARRRTSAAEKVLQKWQAKQLDLNLELESLNAKAKRSEDRMYSGTVSNPKELTDLQNEIASLGRRREALEDNMLEAMIAIEEAETEKGVADGALADVEEAWQRSQAHLRSEQGELALRLKTLMDERDAHLPSIRPFAVKLYEQIGKRHKGSAVALLKDGICQGCRLNVSMEIVKEVNRGSMAHCNHCDRILSGTW